jgi:DNA mismatch endonuclease (patch repair protein)
MKRRTKEQISYNMSRIKSKGSKIEKLLLYALKKEKINFKKHHSIIGKPDFVILEPKKIALFCDSSFWHGYKKMQTYIHNFKRNKSFWRKKILANILRDKIVNRSLKKEGWLVIRFWDFQLTGNIDRCMEKIKCKLAER